MSLSAPRSLEKIKKGNIGPGYVLIGAEIYWRDRICRALQNQLGLETGSFGLSEFDLRQESLAKVLEMAQSHNLLAPRQLLFVKNAQGMLTSRRGRDAEFAKEDSAEPGTKRAGDLAGYFRDPNPHSTLVFEMMDVDLESDDWREKEKAKSRVESYENICEVVLLTSPRFEEAVELVHRSVEERGQKIAPEAAERLVAAFHRNMGLIQMEVEKLTLYHPETGKIGVDDLAVMISGGVAEAGHGLTESIGARDAAGALEALDGLKRGGKYAPLVISEIARYLRQLIVIKESKARDPHQAAKVLWDAKLGVPQAMVSPLVQQSRNFSGAELLRGLQLALDADIAMRSSPPDETLVLERLVLELARPMPQMRGHHNKVVAR